jgi:hypothetical protein
MSGKRSEALKRVVAIAATPGATGDGPERRGRQSRRKSRPRPAPTKSTLWQSGEGEVDESSGLKKDQPFLAAICSLWFELSKGSVLQALFN